MIERPEPVDILVGDSRGGAVWGVLGNALAAALDGEALVASCDDMQKYDGRIIRVEVIGKDGDEMSSVMFSLVPQ